MSEKQYDLNDPNLPTGVYYSYKQLPPSWHEFMSTIPQFNQRQDSTQDQLQDLYNIANRLGFYDAADFLKQHI